MGKGAWIGRDVVITSRGPWTRLREPSKPRGRREDDRMVRIPQDLGQDPKDERTEISPKSGRNELKKKNAASKLN